MRVFKTSDMEEARQFFQEHLGKIALFTYEEGEYVIVIKDEQMEKNISGNIEQGTRRAQGDVSGQGQEGEYFAEMSLNRLASFFITTSKYSDNTDILAKEMADFLNCVYYAINRDYFYDNTVEVNAELIDIISKYVDECFIDEDGDFNIRVGDKTYIIDSETFNVKGVQ